MAIIHLLDVDDNGNKSTRCGRESYAGVGYTGNESWVTCPECRKKIERQAEQEKRKHVICHVKSGDYAHVVADSLNSAKVWFTDRQFATKFRLVDARKLCAALCVMGLAGAGEYAIEEAQ